MAREATPMIQRLIKKNGHREVLTAFLMAENGSSQAEIARHFGWSPSYTTALFKGIPRYTTFRLPLDLLEYSISGEDFRVFSGTSKRAGQLAAAGIPPIDPGNADNFLDNLKPPAYFNFMLDPSLRSAAYWAHHDLRGNK